MECINGIPQTGKTQIETWTNTTRPNIGKLELVGYNTEEKRWEFYSNDDNKWYYLWQESIATHEPISPTLFSDDFESLWFASNQFIPLFTETFGSSWFTDGMFHALFAETLESDWFINNVFSGLFSEGFENGGW